MTDIKHAAMKVQDAIYKEEFYIRLYEATLAKHNMSVASIDQSEFSDKQLILMMNDFWEALPDSPVIRRAPFFALCDICEEIYE